MSVQPYMPHEFKTVDSSIQRMPENRLVTEMEELRCTDKTRDCVISVCACCLWPATATVSALAACAICSYEAACCKTPSKKWKKLFKHIESPPENKCQLACSILYCTNACRCDGLQCQDYDPAKGHLLPDERARYLQLEAAYIKRTKPASESMG